MDKKIISLLLVAEMFFILSCSRTKEFSDNEFPGMKRVEYVEDYSVFPNPERGFYTPVDYHSVTAPISESTMKSCRIQGRTLLYIGYYLTEYMNSEISQDYIDLMQANFDVLRKNGMKCILRYAYKDGYAESDKPWDAEVDIVLSHVRQLKPLWQKNADVIFCLQSGFVGAWGEWYFTDHFVFNPSSEEDYKARKQLVEAQLDAMPENRQICLRTPEYKRMILGLAYSDTLTSESAFKGTPQARLAGHNDCFLAASDDWGTFPNKRDRTFWESETRYTIMGGETCNPCKFSECDNSIKDMELQHWTYLNHNYHQGVIGGWRKNKCFAEIERRLGYRLVLRQAYFSETCIAGNEFRIIIDLENKGFAAPSNPRLAEIILKGEDGKIYTRLLDINPQRWFPGQIFRIDEYVVLPENTGKYTVYLNLPDPEESLRENPEFSIRLANEACWEESTGFNKLYEVKVR